jgi:hypothetical protein
LATKSWANCRSDDSPSLDAIQSHDTFQDVLNRLKPTEFSETFTQWYAAENVSLMNKISLHRLKNERSVKVGIKNKRLKAGWDNDYMMKVLTVGFKSV